MSSKKMKKSVAVDGTPNIPISIVGSSQLQCDLGLGETVKVDANDGGTIFLPSRPPFDVEAGSHPLPFQSAPNANYGTFTVTVQLLSDAPYPHTYYLQNIGPPNEESPSSTELFICGRGDALLRYRFNLDSVNVSLVNNGGADATCYATSLESGLCNSYDLSPGQPFQFTFYESVRFSMRPPSAALDPAAAEHPEPSRPRDDGDQSGGTEHVDIILDGSNKLTSPPVVPCQLTATSRVLRGQFLIDVFGPADGNVIEQAGNRRQVRLIGRAEQEALCRDFGHGCVADRFSDNKKGSGKPLPFDIRSGAASVRRPLE